jgi:hypothetical protein
MDESPIGHKTSLNIHLDSFPLAIELKWLLTGSEEHQLQERVKGAVSQ